MSQTTPGETELAFEQGYERLQAIAERLNDEEVPVSEMCELFAEGKGLERALTEFLDTQRQRIEAIERGEGIRTFRIRRVSAASPDTRPQDSASTELSARASGSSPETRSRMDPPDSGGAADDIPF